MITSSARRLAAYVAACLLIVLAAAGTASAVPARPSALAPHGAPRPAAGPAPRDGSPPGRATFGVQPSGAEAPDARPNFSYGVTPGAAVSDHIAVWNYSTRPLTLRVYAADAINTADGGFDLLAAGKKSKDAGAWVKLAQNQVTVKSRSKVIVGFTLTVPAKATPGDHVGGIVASLSGVRTDEKGDKVTVDQRVGARVYLRVAGALAPRLAVEDLHTSYHGTADPFGSGSATVTYTLRNTGNVRLAAHQTVRAHGTFGDARTAQPRDVPELLPGSSLRVTTAATGLFPSLRGTTTVTADPRAVHGDVLPPTMPRTTVSAGFWAVPWTLLAVLVVLLAGLTVLVVRYARGRRGGPDRGGAGRNPAEKGSKRPRTSRAAAPAAMALAAAVLWAGAPHAAAAPAAQLTVTPGKGSSTRTITLTAARACPAGTTNVIARIEGAGFPQGGQIVVGNSPLSTYPEAAAGGLSIPLTYTMRDYAMTAGFTTLRGTYTFTVTCLKGAFSRKGVREFTGSLRFTSADAYRDGTQVPGVDPAASTDPNSDPNSDPAPTGPAASGASGASGQGAQPGASAGASGGTAAPGQSGQPAQPGQSAQPAQGAQGAQGATAGAGSGATAGPSAGAGRTLDTAASTVRQGSNAQLVFWSVAGFAVAFLVLAAGAVHRVRGRRAARAQNT